VSDGAFYGYIALLFASGVLLAVLAVAGFGQTKLARVFDAIFGVGFLAYSLYLLLFFDGGEVRILFYAFIVPIFAVIQMVKGVKARREAAGAQYSSGPYAPAAQYPGGQAPSPYGQAPSPYGQAPSPYGQAPDSQSHPAGPHQ
jgi:hypothetical protein